MSINRTNITVEFEKGNMAVKDAVRIASLYGTWKEMGRQYGHFFSNQMNDIFNKWLKPQLDDTKRAEFVRDTAEKVFAFYPYRLKQFFKGMAETSGMDMETLKIVNALEYVTEVPFCSAISVWGDYAKDGLIYGRNYDYHREYLSLHDDVAISIFHPSDGSQAFLTAGYAGEIYAVSGLNESGIFAQLNTGMPSTGFGVNFEKLSSTVQLFELLSNADSIDYVDAFFRTVRSGGGYTIGVTDGKKARSYEWCEQGMKRGEEVTPDGLMVMTNHYAHPDWDFETPDDGHSWNSISRRCNIEAFAEKKKGSITSEDIRELMSTMVEDGGAMSKETVYQMVYEPDNNVLWFRIVEGSDWIKIELKAFIDVNVHVNRDGSH